MRIAARSRANRCLSSFHEREHDYAWIVAPECDGLMLDLADAVGPARWIGCTKEAIALASAQSARRHAPRVVRYCGDACARTGAGRPRTQHRWVVKPDDGAGGLDTFVFDDADREHAPNMRRGARRTVKRCCRRGWTATR
ncbi:hypothetical protein BZM27_05705 [Paraburkholderia steynii]|uniref:Tyramine--L-glutamate ligase pre ATP-grasp domain-containing protein n=1 Tax=Paraburkholderia steynii TaxID=1245441 RepID=A0A4R0XPT2_9BURK|nr:hypothetical protein BZM27_05705 [Paraburkholderia steynii]